MKNNKGITIVSLVIIIILLLIFSSIAVYTSVKSFEMIGLQKYKAQMQAIQNGLDEFYEKYENFYTKNKDVFQMYTGTEEENMELYLSYLYCAYDSLNPDNATLQGYISEMIGAFNVEQEGNSYADPMGFYNDYMKINNYGKCYNNDSEDVRNWWVDNAPGYGITTDEDEVKNQYYGLSVDEIETLLGVKDIDISEYFIINFKNRYVFSEKSINIDTKDGTTKEIYCLYELDEEEKIVEFKVDSGLGGSLKLEIVEKNFNYQTVKLTLQGGRESTIKKVYYEDIEGDFLSIESNKNDFEEVTGIGTEEVFIKIKRDKIYNFAAEDPMDGLYKGTIQIWLHQTPEPRNNMVPFKMVKENDTWVGVICDVADPNWYDYNQNIYATVILEDTSSGTVYSQENKGKVITDLMTTNNYVVKVWVPYKDRTRVISSGLADNADFVNKKGIWITAKWDASNNRWSFAQAATLNIESISFDKNNLNINVSGGNKYYYKTNQDTEYTMLTSGTTISIQEDNIREKIQTVEIYSSSTDGALSKVKKVRLKSNDISSYNLIKNGSFESGDNNWLLMNNITITDEDKYTGEYSLQFKPDGIEESWDTPMSQQILDDNAPRLDHTYYGALMFKSSLEFSALDARFEWFFSWEENGGYHECPMTFGQKNDKKYENWTKISNVLTQTSNYKLEENWYFRNFVVDPKTTSYTDDIVLIDLTKLHEEKSYLKIENNKDWCDYFIESNAGITRIYYYQ